MPAPEVEVEGPGADEKAAVWARVACCDCFRRVRLPVVLAEEELWVEE